MESIPQTSPLVVIVGETASGKSQLAIELAQKFDGEVICADSWTVYKGFDIGTAKPTLAEQQRVPHHLLDVTDPAKGFNVVQFQALTKQAITDIQSRGKLPILVGGTGLYVDSIIYDYQFLPPTDPALRQELNDLNLEQLLQRVTKLGLDTTGIDLRNKRRVIRLIENNGMRPSKHDLRQGTVILGIQTDRDSLHQRIELRTEAMLAAGLEAEVRALTGRYGWDVEPMKGVGYWQWQSYFAGEMTLAETRESIIKGCMDLAKRQRTWFKRNSSIHWLSNRDKYSEAVDFLTTFSPKL